MEQVLELEVSVGSRCGVPDVGEEVEGGDHGYVEPSGMASGAKVV